MQPPSLSCKMCDAVTPRPAAAVPARLRATWMRRLVLSKLMRSGSSHTLLGCWATRPATCSSSPTSHAADLPRRRQPPAHSTPRARSGAERAGGGAPRVGGQEHRQHRRREARQVVVLDHPSEVRHQCRVLQRRPRQRMRDRRDVEGLDLAAVHLQEEPPEMMQQLPGSTSTMVRSLVFHLAQASVLTSADKKLCLTAAPKIIPAFCPS